MLRFLPLLALLFWLSGASGITCKASVGNSCSGASYCRAIWKKNGSTWTLNSAACVWTTLGFSTLDTWSLVPSTGIATHTCVVNMCNNAAPPAVVPTVTPTPAPSTLTCIKAFGGTPGSCTSTACDIISTQSRTLQGCAPRKFT